MTTLLLVRHGRTTANAQRVLAGHSPGAPLDELGQQQSHALARRLSDVKLATLVSSPMQRCQQTLAPLVASGSPQPVIEERLAECHYGEWTGRSLSELALGSQWSTVQEYPSSMR